jgi:hypothetical protein
MSASTCVICLANYLLYGVIYVFFPDFGFNGYLDEEKSGVAPMTWLLRCVVLIPLFVSVWWMAIPALKCGPSWAAPLFGCLLLLGYGLDGAVRQGTGAAGFVVGWLLGMALLFLARFCGENHQSRGTVLIVCLAQLYLLAFAGVVPKNMAMFVASAPARVRPYVPPVGAALFSSLGWIICKQVMKKLGKDAPLSFAGYQAHIVFPIATSFNFFGVLAAANDPGYEGVRNTVITLCLVRAIACIDRLMVVSFVWQKVIQGKKHMTYPAEDDLALRVKIYVDYIPIVVFLLINIPMMGMLELRWPASSGGLSFDLARPSLWFLVTAYLFTSLMTDAAVVMWQRVLWRRRGGAEESWVQSVQRLLRPGGHVLPQECDPTAPIELDAPTYGSDLPMPSLLGVRAEIWIGLYLLWCWCLPAYLQYKATFPCRTWNGADYFLC